MHGTKIKGVWYYTRGWKYHAAKQLARRRKTNKIAHKARKINQRKGVKK